MPIHKTLWGNNYCELGKVRVTVLQRYIKKISFIYIQSSNKKEKDESFSFFSEYKFCAFNYKLSFQNNTPVLIQ